MHNIPLPIFAKKAANIKEINEKAKVNFDEFVSSSEETKSSMKKKNVKFSGDIDDDHEGDWQSNEIKKLNERLVELSVENSDMRLKLDQKNYTRVYKENNIL